MKATAAELPAGLIQEINAIHNEVELRDDTLFLEVVGEEVDAVKSEGGLAAPLGVPDDALANASVDFALDRLCRKDLRIAHDMLLEPLLRFHISETKAQHESQAGPR